MRLTVIIPTIGRPSLAATLASIAAQAHPPHEVLLMVDGRRPDARTMWELAGLPGRYIETPFTGHWGAEQRNLAIELATGDWISFQDDDDVYTPDAFEAIAATLPAPAVPTVYRMRYPEGRELWSVESVTHGNIGSQMIVVPNDARLGRYAPIYEGDFAFISETVTAHGGKVLFRPEVITLVQPHRKTFTPSMVDGGVSCV